MVDVPDGPHRADVGSSAFFLRFAKEQVPYAIKRYSVEATRLYAVLNRRLGEVGYLAGDYSTDYIAAFPWVVRCEWHRIDLANYPNVLRWHNNITERPAVQRGMAVPGAAI